MSKEIKPLTALRAIAAGLVFFYHFIYLRHQVPAQNVFQAILENGFIGVTIFFALSGFVLTLRYSDDILNNNFNWRLYVQRRVARIYPIYFFILACVALLHVPINLSNVTLTQGYFTRLQQTGDIAAWTLTVEETFYLMLPFALRIIVRLRHLLLVAVVLLAWTMIMLGIGQGLVLWSNATGIVKQAGFMGDTNYMLYRTVFGYIFDFCVGIFAAMLYRKRGSFGFKVSTALTILGVGGIITFQWLMAVYPAQDSARLLMYCVAVCAGILMFGLTNPNTLLSKVLAWRPLVYMGRISYAVYLLQLTQIVWFMATWNVVLFYIGTNVLSALLYQFIEEPMRKLITSWGKPRQEPRTSAPAVSLSGAGK